MDTDSEQKEGLAGDSPDYEALGYEASGSSQGQGMEMLGLSFGTDVLASFGSLASRPRRRPFYLVALLLVALLMVVLPGLYVGFALFVGWAVKWYATNFIWLIKPPFHGLWGAVYRAIAYVGPMVAGAVLTLFLFKPLFARRLRRPQPLAVNPAAEPLLYAVIARVCDLVGAAMPARIDVDCTANASASFRNGWAGMLSGKLVLTIGLSLAAVLNLREFAGVLAHELGHFNQALAMRLSFLIRSINSWFARVVYERDAWDQWLKEEAESEIWQYAFVMMMAQLGVWVSRVVLRLLMLAGAAVSCLLMREMEYDADACEIRVSGSEGFESVTRRLRLVEAAEAVVQASVSQSRHPKRTLPADYPAFMAMHVAALPEELRLQIEDSLGLVRTRWFDTHPSPADRIQRARQAADDGIFHRTEPAGCLFSNFEVICKQATLSCYRDELGLPVTAHNLVPVGDAAPSSDASE